MQWRAQTTRGAAGKTGGGRLVERPARLAVQAGWGLLIAVIPPHPSYINAPAVKKNKISR